jgi:diaminohydroxyphosphoribosylaminopyrimidine deaminase/5-amino-6-(5-phosphoribosylamino)uracil reductase
LASRGVGLAATELDSNGRIALRPLLQTMASRGIVRLLVEGGGQLAGAMLEAGLVDRIELFVAPIVLGDRGAPAFVLASPPSIGLAPRGVLESCVNVDGDAQLSVRLRR